MNSNEAISDITTESVWDADDHPCGNFCTSGDDDHRMVQCSAVEFIYEGLNDLLRSKSKDS